MERIEGLLSRYSVDVIKCINSDFQGSEVPHEMFDQAFQLLDFKTSNSHLFILGQSLPNIFITDFRYMSVLDKVNAESNNVEGILQSKEVDSYEIIAKKLNKESITVGQDLRFISAYAYHSLCLLYIKPENRSPAWVEDESLSLTGAMEPKLGLINSIVHVPLIDMTVMEKKPIRPIPLEFTDAQVETKVLKIIDHMKANKADWTLLAGLEDCPYVLNLRLAENFDSPLHPGFFSYLAISTDKTVVLFCENSLKLNILETELKALFKFEIKSLNDFEGFISNLSEDSNVFANFHYLSQSYLEALRLEAKVNVKHDTFTADCRQEKTDVARIARMQRANIVEGLALTIVNLELHRNGTDYTESDVSALLINTRKQAAKIISSLDPTFGDESYYRGESFVTIAAAGSNAANCHYRPNSDNKDKIKDYILIDTGAHYYEGTTDTTRMIALKDELDPELKYYASLVLKGQINMQRTRWRDSNINNSRWKNSKKIVYKDDLEPNDKTSITINAHTKFAQITAVARGPLLYNANYVIPHGISHGIGLYSSVHEDVDYTGNLKEGNFLSIEPGAYFLGEFGIRYENVVRVKRFGADTLGFEVITCAPIELKGWVDETVLDEYDIQYVNDYNKKVLERLKRFLTDTQISEYRELFLNL